MPDGPAPDPPPSSVAPTEWGGGPPRARATFHLGIVGHRRLGPEATSAVLVRLREVLAACREEAGDLSGSGPAPRLRIVSCLAEGADRLAVRAGLELGYRLLCALPFAREEFAHDFATEASRREFRDLLERAESVLELDGRREAADAYYLAAGRIVLNHADVLIAVWDGAAARGVGGTAAIVEDAVRHGVPVVWIEAEAPHRIRCLAGGVPHEYRSRLRDRIAWALGVDSTAARRGAEAWFAERARGGDAGRLYRLFRNLLLLRWPREAPGRDGLTRAAAAWDEAWGGAAEPPYPWREAVDRHFRTHFAWADSLAVHYANLYRTSYLLRYAFGMVAIVGVIVGFYGGPRLSLYGFLAQALFLTVVVAISRLAVRRRWNERAIDDRLLAELLRNMRYLYPLGRVSPVLRAPAHDPLSDVSWVNAHYRDVVREAGLIDARIDDGFLAAYQRFLGRGELEALRAFYRVQAEEQGALARRLERLGMLLFHAGLFAIVARVGIAVAGHLGGDVGELPRLAHQLSFFLPALAPMLFGLSSQAQYARIAQRYAAMERLLASYQSRVETLEAPSSKELGLYAEETATRVTDEVSDWGVLVRARKLSPF